MWILDRQRYWAFLKAYVVCFVSLVGLYVVIHAFSNVDEFTKIEDKLVPLLKLMGWYYLVRVSQFYDQLCGVISMMAAIFTVTWMQRNNEHLAMLAAGISTRRVIRPVLVSAVVVSSLAVANQELVIPRISEELQRTPDDDGRREVKAWGMYRDVNGIHIQSSTANRSEMSIKPFDATFPPDRFGQMFRLHTGQPARYIPDDDPLGVVRGGWLVRGADLAPSDAPVDGEILVRIDPDPLALVATAGLAMPAAEGASAALPAVGGAKSLAEGTYFLRSNLGFSTITQRRDWYQYASTGRLLRSLKDPTFASEHNEIAVMLHARNIRPLLAMTLLCLSLPLVLGGQGRNMFINLGLSMGTSALFYIVLFVAQYLGNNHVTTPILAAWGPLVLFGTIAAGRWDRIRS